MSDAQNTNYFNSLKGIAILGVTLIHSGGSGLPGVWGQLATSGGMCVSIFFIISGYLAFLSFEKNLSTPSPQKLSSVFTWYKKKLLRLIPMYYLAIIISMITNNYSTFWLGNEGHVTVWNIISHVLFLHGLFPHYTNSILSVEWYLGVLFLFYLLTPLLFRLINSLEKSIIALIISIMACPIVNSLICSLLPFENDPVVYSTYKDMFSPLRHFPVYIMGMCIFFILKSKDIFSFKHSRPLSYSLLIFSLFMLIGQALGQNTLFHISNQIMYGIWFSIIILSQSIHTSPILCNSIFDTIGKYSYVMYLFQFIVINTISKFYPADNSETIILGFLINSVVLFLISFILTKLVVTPIHKLLT